MISGKQIVKIINAIENTDIKRNNAKTARSIIGKDSPKPIRLYKWLLHNYAKEGDKILDTHVGSGSSLIACEELGFDYVGFELDKDYYDSATKRIGQARFERESKAAPECVTKGLSLFEG